MKNHEYINITIVCIIIIATMTTITSISINVVVIVVIITMCENVLQRACLHQAAHHDVSLQSLVLVQPTGD